MTRRARTTLTFMAYASFFGFLFPFGFMLLMRPGPLRVLDTLVAALAISLVSGPGITLLFLVVIPFTKRLPFIAAVAVQGLGFLLVGALGFFVSISAVQLVGRPTGRDEIFADTLRVMGSGELLNTYQVVFALALVFIGGAQISRKLGRGVLWNWLLGKYHSPREEARIFMFLDLTDSTPIAEKLGTLKFSALIRDFFGDMEYPLAASRGAVSHYIGDEAVIVWRPSRGLDGGRCVLLYFDMLAELELNSARYLQRYGLVPGCKAAVHIGNVVAVEVGGDKSEIVYHGDAVNTTARLSSLCNALGEGLLVSAEIAQAIKNDRIRFEALGAQALKGKAEPMEVFAPRLRAIAEAPPEEPKEVKSGSNG